MELISLMECTEVVGGGNFTWSITLWRGFSSPSSLKACLRWVREGNRSVRVFILVRSLLGWEGGSAYFTGDWEG